MSRIVAAIDDSSAATPVLQMALAVAPLLGAQVHALQVADIAGPTAEACAHAVNVPLQTVRGDPFDEILRSIEADDVTGLVLGARSLRGGRRPAGHVPLALASATAKPVIVVPPDARPPARVRRALVALEGTPRKARALKRTIELAEAAGLELVVVHVEDEESIPPFSDQVHYETEAYANEFLSRYCRGAPSAHLQLRIGAPADEIFAAAEILGPDLIAIGWPHSDDPARGVVAREILDRSHLPVLLVALADSAP